jgi:hypothetical protein
MGYLFSILAIFSRFFSVRDDRPRRGYRSVRLTQAKKLKYHKKRRFSSKFGKGKEFEGESFAADAVVCDGKAERWRLRTISDYPSLM